VPELTVITLMSETNKYSRSKTNSLGNCFYDLSEKWALEFSHDCYYKSEGSI